MLVLCVLPLKSTPSRFNVSKKSKMKTNVVQYKLKWSPILKRVIRQLADQADHGSFHFCYFERHKQDLELRPEQRVKLDLYLGAWKFNWKRASSVSVNFLPDYSKKNIPLLTSTKAETWGTLLARKQLQPCWIMKPVKLDISMEGMSWLFLADELERNVSRGLSLNVDT